MIGHLLLVSASLQAQLQLAEAVSHCRVFVVSDPGPVPSALDLLRGLDVVQSPFCCAPQFNWKTLLQFLARPPGTHPVPPANPFERSVPRLVSPADFDYG